MNSVSSVQNNNIAYKAADIGVLPAPDKIGKPELFSASEADKNFHQMCNDIYQKQSGVIPGKSYSTPKSVIWIGGAAVLAFLWTVCKNIFKR